MDTERGFFCCNKKDPKKFIEAGFTVGLAMPTKFFSAYEIESDGYVGKYIQKREI